MSTPAVRAAVQVVIPAIDAPMRLVAPIGDARLFVLQQDGHVRLFDQQGAALGTFLDISSQTSPSDERGLVGFGVPAGLRHHRPLLRHLHRSGG